MAFVLVNKIIVAGLIIALIIYLFIKKKRADMVFTLSIIVLSCWLVNLIADGYFRTNFANLSFFEIEHISLIDGLSLGLMLIFLFFISFTVTRRAPNKSGWHFEVVARQQKENKEKERDR